MVCLLGGNRGPRFLHPRNHEMDQNLLIPKKLTRGLNFHQHIEKFIQQFKIPLGLFTRRETLARKMPLATHFLPWHLIFDVKRFVHPFFQERIFGIIQKLPEALLIHFGPVMRSNFDFLPRPPH